MIGLKLLKNHHQGGLQEDQHNHPGCSHRSACPQGSADAKYVALSMRLPSSYQATGLIIRRVHQQRKIHSYWNCNDSSPINSQLVFSCFLLHFLVLDNIRG